tara:strand:- start:51 stop:551 length:501 start_codon:yes stop_codon:yes gene_type:complete
MGKTIDKINEARRVIAEIIESEGDFSEENEEWLARYTEDSKEQAEWLGTLYRRAKLEASEYDNTIRLLMEQKRKVNRTASWARDMMYETLSTREALGEGSAVAGAGHLSSSWKLTTPDDPDLWPVEFLKEGPVKFDKVAFKAKYKDKSKELPEGFGWVQARTVVMK